MPRSDSLDGLAAALFQPLAERSAVVHGNKMLLPVAAWVAEAGQRDVTTPEVVRGLAGQVPANKALDALGRLCAIGALDELPHLGRPHARTFTRRESPYWDWVRAEAVAAAEALDE